MNTLGDWTEPTNGRKINYHHGAAPTVVEGPVIVEHSSDPVFRLKEGMSERDFDKLTVSAQKMLSEELM